jgi:steroid delta-isomerase-like uncharacterized protein
VLAGIIAVGKVVPPGEAGGRRAFPMSEENKALVHRFVEEFWNEGNTAAVDELMAIDAAIHLPTGEVVNPEGLKSFAAMWRGVFPDWHSTLEELIAERDRVAERWTGRGTHRGELQGIPPTGKRVEAPGSVFYRIVGGKIVEFRGQFDMMSLMQQIGAIPSPEEAQA